MSDDRIDVHVEHRDPPPPPERKHPNTCPSCGSHFRDDELEAALWVCAQCGYHYPMRARARIAWYADEGSFTVARCSCGWRSYARRSRQRARAEGADHTLLYGPPS